MGDHMQDNIQVELNKSGSLILSRYGVELEPESLSKIISSDVVFARDTYAAFAEANLKMQPEATKVSFIADLGDPEKMFEKADNLITESLQGDSSDCEKRKAKYLEALRLLVSTSAMGYSKAQFFLGLLYVYGPALNWLEQKIELHSFSLRSYKEEAFAINRTEMCRLWQEVAQKFTSQEEFSNCLKGNFSLGVIKASVVKHSNASENVMLLKWFAAKGHLFSQLCLGVICVIGKPANLVALEVNKEEVKNWLSLAAKGNNIIALFCLGILLYKEGKINDATDLFLQAITVCPFPDKKYRMPEDLSHFIMLDKNLSMLFCDEYKNLIFNCIHEVVLQKGNANARTILAYWLAGSDELSRECDSGETATRFIQQMAENKDPNAQLLLGEWLFYGNREGIPKDQKKGMGLLYEAMENNHPKAAVSIGKCHLEKPTDRSYGTYLDTKTAMKFFLFAQESFIDGTAIEVRRIIQHSAP